MQGPSLKNRTAMREERKAQRRKQSALRKDRRERARNAAGRSRRDNVVRGVLLAATLLVCGVPVVLVASPISYVPLITVVLLVGISWAYLRVLKRTFTYSESQMADSCERGQDVGLSVRLSNGSVLPHPHVDVAFYITDLFGEYDATRRMSVTLAPRESGDFDFGARFDHLGKYSAGVDYIVLNDILGLFSARIDNPSRRSVVVRPRVFDFRDPDIADAAEQDTNNMLKAVASDNMDYASVREYRFGDPLKTIHWNLSARTPDATMYTRLYEVYVSPSLSIIVDPFAETADSETLMSLFDGVMESTASLSRFAREQGVECTVRYLDRDFEPGTACLASVEDADELVLDARRITSLESRPSQASIPLDMLAQEGFSSQGASNIAFATARLDEEIVTSLIEIAGLRRNPILLLTVPSALAGRERTRFLAPLRQLNDAGVAYFVFESTELETRVVGA